jgi:hypothetical protein
MLQLLRSVYTILVLYPPPRTQKFRRAVIAVFFSFCSPLTLLTVSTRYSRTKLGPVQYYVKVTSMNEELLQHAAH